LARLFEVSKPLAFFAALSKCEIQGLTHRAAPLAEPFAELSRAPFVS
jgi:hypothetical protein